MSPDQPARRSTLSRRGLIKGGGVVAFGGLSVAALKLPMFGIDPVQACPNGGAAKDVSASERELIISNWTGYIDPRKNPESTLAQFQDQTGIEVTYNVDVNDNAEFYAKVKNQMRACEPIDRDMIVLTDWMASRMINLGFIQPLDKPQGPERRQEPDPVAAGRAVGPEARVLGAVAVRPDRHRLQRRAGAGGRQLRGPDHPRGPARQDHAAQRDGRHDGLLPQGDRSRPGRLRRRRVGERARPAARGEVGRSAPPVRRQQLPAAALPGHAARLRGVVGRRDPGPGRQPEPQVRRTRGGPVPLERQHDGAELRDPPGQRRGLDRLLLPARGRGEARRLGQLHLSGRRGRRRR